MLPRGWHQESKEAKSSNGYDKNVYRTLIFAKPAVLENWYQPTQNEIFLLQVCFQRRR